jgi:hypothetical protein
MVCIVNPAEIVRRSTFRVRGSPFTVNRAQSGGTANIERQTPNAKRLSLMHRLSQSVDRIFRVAVQHFAVRLVKEGVVES